MKRKQQRDLVEMTEKMINNIPQPIEESLRQLM